MCRNIRTLHNFEPSATDDEIRASALQYVRKISGMQKPSAGERRRLLSARSTRSRTSRTTSWKTWSPRRRRATVRSRPQKARARAEKRYASLARR